MRIIVLNKLKEASIFLVVFFFFLPHSISKYFLVLFFISLIASGIKNIQASFLKNINESIFLIFLFLLYLLSGLYSDDLTFYSKSMETFLSLLIIPVIFIVFGIEERDKRIAFNGFIFGAVVAIVLCFCVAFYKSIYLTEGHWIFDARVLKDSRIDFQKAIIWGGNNFFSSQLSIFLHPSYFSMYLIFALVLVAEERGLRKFYKLLLVAVLLITIYFLSSRAGFVTSVIVTLYYTISNLKREDIGRTKKIVFSCIMIGIVVSVLIHPRSQDIVQKVTNVDLSINPDANHGFEIRLLTWHAAALIIKEHVIFGVGVGDVKGQLLNKYNERKYVEPGIKGYNVHNQFLETFVAIGIIGFILLVAIFVVPIAKRMRTKADNVMLLFIMIVFLNWLFESMLNRYEGVVFFSFFYSLLSLNMKKKVILNEKIITNEDLSSGK